MGHRCDFPLICAICLVGEKAHASVALEGYTVKTRTEFCSLASYPISLHLTVILTTHLE